MALFPRGGGRRGDGPARSPWRGVHPARRGGYSPYHFKDGSLYEGTGLPPLPDIDADRGRYRIARFAMEPGDVLAFQAMIVHGSPGNTSANRLRALTTRWTGDDARCRRRPGKVAIPTRDPGLADGAPLDGDRFPLVWTEPSKGELP